jgi:hypothetical protein
MKCTFRATAEYLISAQEETIIQRGMTSDIGITSVGSENTITRFPYTTDSYAIAVEDTTQVFIELHQEDKRISRQGNYFSVGIIILRLTSDGKGMECLADTAGLCDRVVQLRYTFEEGLYFVLPYTLGTGLQQIAVPPTVVPFSLVFYSMQHKLNISVKPFDPLVMNHAHFLSIKLHGIDSASKIPGLDMYIWHSKQSCMFAVETNDEFTQCYRNDDITLVHEIDVHLSQHIKAYRGKYTESKDRKNRGTKKRIASTIAVESTVASGAQVFVNAVFSDKETWSYFQKSSVL